jgi:hypothetical protein
MTGVEHFRDLLTTVVSSTSPLSAFVAGTSKYVGDGSDCKFRNLSIKGLKMKRNLFY